MLRITLVLAAAAVAGTLGCGIGGGGAPGGVLNQLTKLSDVDGDGFAEVEPPDGVTFDIDNTLAMRIANSITRSQAESASGVSLPSAVSGSIALSVNAAVEITYPGGQVQTLRGSFPLGPQELAFEVACPQSVEVLVTAVADTPVTAPQSVETFGPYTRDQGAGQDSFECGGALTVETVADDETGELVASIVVE